MKIATGKSARAIRRREIIARLFSLFDQLANYVKRPSPNNVSEAFKNLEAAPVNDITTEARQLLLELTENITIDTQPLTRPRIRK